MPTVNNLAWLEPRVAQVDQRLREARSNKFDRKARPVIKRCRASAMAAGVDLHDVWTEFNGLRARELRLGVSSADDTRLETDWERFVELVIARLEHERADLDWSADRKILRDFTEKLSVMRQLLFMDTVTVRVMIDEFAKGTEMHEPIEPLLKGIEALWSAPF